jgi:hypothetical protein
MTRGGALRAVWWAVLSLAAFGAWHWLGQVDYPRQASTEFPSAPATVEVNEADLAVKEGAEWARSQGTATHNDCDSRFGQNLRALGCHNKVTASKVIPPLVPWNTHPTTRACLAAVHAHYDPWLLDMVERGNHHAARVNARRHLEPDLRQCQNVDNGRILRDVYEPLERLNATLANLRRGQPLSGAELDQLRRDIPVVEAFRPDPMRSSYLAAADELFSVVGGRERIFPLAPSSGAASESRCAALAETVESTRAGFHALQASATDAELEPGSSGSSKRRLQQDEALSRWTQAATERVLTGCPPW